MMHPKQKCIESLPGFCSSTSRYQHPQGTGRTSCAALCCTFITPPHPRSANSTSFKLQDGCLLNELTLCIFDSGDWWSTSLRMTWHKGAFCSWFFCLFLVFFLLSFVSCFLISFSKVEVPLRASFSIQLLFFFFFFIPFGTPFFTLPQYISLWSQPPVSILSPASVPQPCLSCSRFSFCWRVLIGLKWVTSSITESFKPSLNVSISWGSGGIVVLPFPPLAALLIAGETRGLMGVAKVWPPGKSAGLCQHSLQCTQRPQDQ